MYSHFREVQVKSLFENVTYLCCLVFFFFLYSYRIFDDHFITQPRLYTLVNGPPAALSAPLE